MRAARIVVTGIGVLLAGCLALGCSSDNESAPYDAGELDGFAVPDDVSSPDTSLPGLGADGGVDATLGQGEDAAPPATEDASDSSHAFHDAGVDAKVVADASDAAVDASDAAALDASDSAAQGLDATSPDAPDSGDASTTMNDASTDEAGDTGSSSLDDGGSSSADASDASPFDASALCVGFNLTGDAINGLTAETSPGNVTLDIGTTDPGVNPVPAADTVVVTVTTSPIGVMEDIAVGYFTDGAPTPVYLPMSLVPGAGGGNDEWTGSIPAIAAGAQVSFFVVGHDYCKTNAGAGADYYSNSGSNYHYETQ